MRTLMDSSGSDRLQHRTALVGKELGRYSIKIAALSETRLAEVGAIKIVGASYTFFCSGRKRKQRCEVGVGFVIKSDLVGKLAGLTKDINDHLMTLRLLLSGNESYATSISGTYAYSMTNPDEVKDNFCDDLHVDPFIFATSRTDKLILLAHFDAGGGTD